MIPSLFSMQCDAVGAKKGFFDIADYLQTLVSKAGFIM